MFLRNLDHPLLLLEITLCHFRGLPSRDPRTTRSRDRPVRLDPSFSKFCWSWSGSVQDILKFLVLVQSGPGFLKFFWSWSELVLNFSIFWSKSRPDRTAWSWTSRFWSVDPCSWSDATIRILIWIFPSGIRAEIRFKVIVTDWIISIIILSSLFLIVVWWTTPTPTRICSWDRIWTCWNAEIFNLVP